MEEEIMQIISYMLLGGAIVSFFSLVLQEHELIKPTPIEQATIATGCLVLREAIDIIMRIMK